MGRESIEAALLIHNRQFCQPPLEDEEVRRTAASAARYQLGCEWAMDPLGYARHVAEAYGLRANDGFVLAALYRAANDRGIVRRGMRRIAQETGLHVETVHGSLGRLRAMELVTVTAESRRFGNTYRLKDVLSPLQPQQGEQEGGPSVRKSEHLPPLRARRAHGRDETN